MERSNVNFEAEINFDLFCESRDEDNLVTEYNADISMQHLLTIIQR